MATRESGSLRKVEKTAREKKYSSWQWRQRRDGRFCKDYLSANEWHSVEQRRQAQRLSLKLPTTEAIAFLGVSPKFTQTKHQVSYK